VPTDWATYIVAMTVQDPSCYAPIAKDVLAVQNDGLVCGAEGLSAYDACVHRTKLCLDEGVHS
jgi:hypothetical protein